MHAPVIPSLYAAFSVKLVDTVWFLVMEVEPYYGKYKGILATDNMVQLKRYYGSATGSDQRPAPLIIRDRKNCTWLVYIKGPSRRLMELRRAEYILCFASRQEILHKLRDGTSADPTKWPASGRSAGGLCRFSNL
jgi:hypothetical protein